MTDDRINPDWDPATVKLAEEMIEVGEEWETVMERKKALSPRRSALFVALEERRVSHSTIARLARSTKGAVEQALVAAKKAES